MPHVSFLGYAAFVFYGASMLEAPLRGYAGCDVMAISNWILSRDDQVGCLVLGPIDSAEQRLRGSMKYRAPRSVLVAFMPGKLTVEPPVQS